MTIEVKKLALIRKIMEIGDESVIDQIEDVIEHQPNPGKDWILNQLNKPIRKHINIEEIKREQNFQEINKKEIETLIEEADIKESIEELLKMV